MHAPLSTDKRCAGGRTGQPRRNRTTPEPSQAVGPHRTDSTDAVRGELTLRCSRRGISNRGQGSAYDGVGDPEHRYEFTAAQGTEAGGVRRGTKGRRRLDGRIGILIHTAPRYGGSRMQARVGAWFVLDVMALVRDGCMVSVDS